MKKFRIVLAAFATFLCLAALTACGVSMEETDVSFDDIVCVYEIYPLLGSEPPTSYTVYADNTVEVFCNTEWYNDKEGGGEWELDRRFAISDEERSAIENSITQSKLWTVYDCSDNGVTDGTNEFIYLCDADGEVIHTCGGYNPTDKRFREAADLILRTARAHS
ncbi:MAG: hypothetical protein E7559_04690 [Ruminococcaceae bacterium]|nr:hypothetical protein [Oscillospiraceae bacterium]